MARMKMSLSLATSIKIYFYQNMERITWEIHRYARYFTRRFGLWGWSLLILLLAGILVWRVDSKQLATLRRLQTLSYKSASKNEIISAQPFQRAKHIELADDTDARARLKSFEEYLLPHENIPFVLEDVFRLAKKEGLSIQRGEYQAQIDSTGGFLRYRMSFPLKGAAPAVHRFLHTALSTHKTLALESLQFKRERIDSIVLEARLQCVVLTHLPVDKPSSFIAAATTSSDPKVVQ